MRHLVASMSTESLDVDTGWVWGEGERDVTLTSSALTQGAPTREG